MTLEIKHILVLDQTGLKYCIIPSDLYFDTDTGPTEWPEASFLYHVV